MLASAHDGGLDPGRRRRRHRGGGAAPERGRPDARRDCGGLAAPAAERAARGATQLVGGEGRRDARRLGDGWRRLRDDGAERLPGRLGPGVAPTPRDRHGAGRASAGSSRGLDSDPGERDRSGPRLPRAVRLPADAHPSRLGRRSAHSRYRASSTRQRRGSRPSARSAPSRSSSSMPSRCSTSPVMTRSTRSSTSSGCATTGSIPISTSS